MKKGINRLLILALFVSIIYIGFTSAAITCNVTQRSDCNSNPNGNVVMGLYATSNSHGENASYTDYNYVLCCYNFGQGDTSCLPLGNPAHPIYGSSVPDNKVIGLSAPTNAHAEVPGDTNYDVNVCYNGLECVSSSSGCDSNYPINVFNLSSDTNSHISATPTAGFDIAICCKVLNIPSPSCSLSSATWSESSVLAGDSVVLDLAGTNCDGAGINYTIRNSNGDVISSVIGTFPNYTWTANPAGDYTFTAEAIASGSSQTSNTLTVNLNSIDNCPNYPYTQCSDYKDKTTCNANNIICHANTSDYAYSFLTDPTSSSYDPSFSYSYCSWNDSTSKCQFKYVDNPLPNVPLLCSGTSCSSFTGCGSGYTLCENSSSNSVYCFPGYNCPSGDEPSSGGTCGWLEGGCSSAICNPGDQDTCALGTTCLKQPSDLGGGGICNGTTVSNQYCSLGTCYNQSFTSGGCGNGYTLCDYKGTNFCYPGTSCPEGTTTPETAGQCGPNDSCASPGCLNNLSNPKGSCIGDAYCKDGSCYSPTAFSGTCTLTTTTSGNCSQGGFLQLNINATWTGDPNKVPPSCTDGTRQVECPPQIPLPFFNIYNAIATVTALILIYATIILLKKKHPKRKK